MVSYVRSTLILLGAAAVLTACAPGPSGDNAAATPTGIENPTTEMYKPVPLLWEGAAKDGLLWSALSYRYIGGDEAQALLPGSEDIADFCPAYASLRESQKVNFWAYLVSALAKLESDFGRRVLHSREGLLGLSSADVPGANSLSDPATNLAYGIQILGTQVSTLKRLATSASHWVSLDPVGAHLNDLTALTRALPFCEVKR